MATTPYTDTDVESNREEERGYRCTRHGNVAQKLYCLRCKDDVCCDECSVVEHGEHVTSIRRKDEIETMRRREMGDLVSRGVASTVFRLDLLNALEEKQSEARTAVEERIRELRDVGRVFEVHLKAGVQERTEHDIIRLQEATRLGKRLLETGSCDDIIRSYDEWSKNIAGLLEVPLAEDLAEIDRMFQQLQTRISIVGQSLSPSDETKRIHEPPLQLYWQSSTSIQRKDETHCSRRVRTILPGLHGGALVVYEEGGVEAISTQGLRSIYATGVACKDAACLSDAKIVVLRLTSDLDIYTGPEGREDIVFHLERASACESVAVDQEDNILALVNNARKVLVFRSKGGHALKSIAIKVPIRDTPSNITSDKLMLNDNGDIAIQFMDCPKLMIFDPQGHPKSAIALGPRDFASFSPETNHLWVMSPNKSKLGVFQKDGALLHECSFPTSTMVLKGCAVAPSMYFCQITEFGDANHSHPQEDNPKNFPRLRRLRSRIELNPGSTATTKFVWLEIKKNPCI